MSKEDFENRPDIEWDAEPAPLTDSEKGFHSAAPKEDPFPLIPEGEYEAVCFKQQIRPYLGNEKRLYLHYEIISGDYRGIKLFQSINFIYKSFPKKSKYYTEWTIANGTQPRRKDKMSPRIFKDRAFLVKVKTSKPRYDDGTHKPEIFHYSTVERIIEVLT